MANGIVVKRDEDEFDGWLRKRCAQAASMLERWGMKPRELLSTEIGWLLCLPKFDGKDILFDLFQVGFLLQKARFRSMLKARQVGFSFAIACESIARCHLKNRHTAVCVSYNLDDAKEKVSLAKELHDELPLEFQKKIVIDSKTQVGFRSNASHRQISKIISNPAKAPRGKTGDVYLDELAHCANDRAIYAGATALISRSGGQLTIGSTPLGKRGVFHDVQTQEFNRYPGYWRQRVPWWLCGHFSTIVNDAEKIALAETLPTEARVDRYGTAALRDQFNALPLEDFQQEFECAFQDERVAFFPYELIIPCTRETSAIPVFETFEELVDAAGKLGPLVLGYDVGRTKHPSELVIFERQGEDRASHHYVMRYREQFKDVPFPQQRRRVEHIIDSLGTRLVKARIDDTGLGKNLGEDLVERYGDRRIEAVTFTMAKKEQLANSLKILLQARAIELAKDRGLIAQIHSIKQKITASGNSVFDAEKNRTHHADLMWAIALACFDPWRKKRAGVMVLTARTIGEAKREEEAGDENEDAPASPTSPKEDRRGLVERLFDVPDSPTRRGNVAILGSSTCGTASPPKPKKPTLSRLLYKIETLDVAIGAWRESGRDDKVAELEARRARLEALVPILSTS